MNDSRSFVITSATGTATLKEVAKKKVGDTTTGFFTFALIFSLSLPFSPKGNYTSLAKLQLTLPISPQGHCIGASISGGVMAPREREIKGYH